MANKKSTSSCYEKPIAQKLFYGLAVSFWMPPKPKSETEKKREFSGPSKSRCIFVDSEEKESLVFDD